MNIETCIIVCVVSAAQAVPHVVKAWKKRSDAEVDLLVDLRKDVKELTGKLCEAEARIDTLEADWREASSLATAFRVELEITKNELADWRKKATKLAEELLELRRAITGGFTHVTLPPPKE